MDCWTSWSPTTIGLRRQGALASRKGAYANAVNTAMQLNHMNDIGTAQWHDTTAGLSGKVTHFSSMAGREASRDEAIRRNNIAKVAIIRQANGSCADAAIRWNGHPCERIRS